MMFLPLQNASKEMLLLKLNRIACLAVSLLPISSVVYVAHAQEETGSISGTVKDASGAVVRGATVTLVNTDRSHTERVLTTSGAGFFTATSLPLGTYTVTISDTGFKTENVTSLVLHANDALTVNRSIMPGDTTESVTVQADPVQLNLEDATSAGLINGAQVRELVLNARNYESLLQLQPGVVYGGATDQLYVGAIAPSGTANQVNFSVNGGRNTSNNWTIDGADNVDRGADLTLLTYPSIDAIAEFKTLRGQYSAQFGRGASGQIDVITKSGANQIHGSAYEFFRNDILNANGYFNKIPPVLARPKLRYNDFGGTVGGPVFIPKIYNGHDKSFFFFSDEVRRVVQYSSGSALVPTANERMGDFSNVYYLPASGPNKGVYTRGPVSVCTAFNPANGACTTFGSQITTISPTAQAYLKDIYANVPLPPSDLDVAAGLDPHTINSTVPNIFNNNQVLFRIDQAVGTRLNVFYRYIHDTFPSIQGTGAFTAVPIPGISTTINHNPGTQQEAHGTYVFSPTLLMNVGYAYSADSIFTDPAGAFTLANSADVKPALPFPVTLGVIPTITQTNLTPLGSTGIYRDYDTNHNAFGDVTKTLGRNTIIVGVDYNHYQKKENATGGNQGAFTFNTGTPTTATGLNPATTADASFANFLLGNANGGFSQSSLAITPIIQENIIEGFFQDNWKATPRLTLTAGVRYSYYGQPIDAGGRLSNFDPATYSAAKAPTISSLGLACFANPCPNLDGQNSGTVNGNADYLGANYINGLIYGGPNTNGQPSPYGSKIGATDNTNFAPRLGFAFDLFGDGKTALRGGYGYSFDESEVSFYETAVFNNPPAVNSFSLTTATLDNPAGTTAAATSPSTTPGRIVASPTDYHTPYVQQYSLDVQQQITPTILLDVGYFGTHGTHLLGLVDINEAVPGSFVGRVNPINVSSTCVLPGTGGTTGVPAVPAFISTLCDRGLNQIKPYLGFFAIDAVRSIFSSNYNSLQVKATKRFAGQSLVDINYTFSRDLTNSQNDYSTPPQNTYNINADYGRAADDRNNVITFDFIYELPYKKDQRGLVGHVVGGWETSGIVAVNSGLPLTVTESAGATINYLANGAAYTSALNGQTTGGYTNDAAGLGILGNTNAGIRPDQIGNPNNGYGQKIHQRLLWFYTGAFSTPTPQSARVGNDKRGSVNGPGFNRIDLGLFRNFKIHEGLNFQFRSEAYNLLNHTNFQTVSTSASASNFGQVTSTRDNRILQFAGKLEF